MRSNRPGGHVGDSLYSQLKHARQVATTADATAFGVEIGIVTNVKDPDKQGRVKVCFPRLPGKPESDWARVAQPAAGDGRGFYWIPHVNDEVLIGFERGQTNRPFVIGSLWNGKDKPMKTAYVDENTTVMIQTKSGHQIVISDKNGEEKIIIGDMSGKRTVTFDVKAEKFLIEAKEGDVELHAEKKLVLECEDLEIKTSKTGKADIGTTFDLNISQKGGIQAGPVLNIKASKVELNPSGGAGCAGERDCPDARCDQTASSRRSHGSSSRRSSSRRWRGSRRRGWRSRPANGTSGSRPNRHVSRNADVACGRWNDRGRQLAIEARHWNRGSSTGRTIQLPARGGASDHRQILVGAGWREGEVELEGLGGFIRIGGNPMPRRNGFHHGPHAQRCCRQARLYPSRSQEGRRRRRIGDL